MESHSQDLLSEACSRPRHFFVDQWYDHSVRGGVTAQISYGVSSQEDEVFSKRKASRRFERWWHKPIDNDYETPSSDKLGEAKRKRFTAEGKQARVSKSLAALSHPSNIRLTPGEWREIVEDSDLEDQF
jgi:hypothetical protein